MKQDMPLISVIVPVYNVEAYLAECVESILAQSYEHLQIILVDDGSADGSGSLCAAYAERDARVELIRKENGGLSSARNAGIERAKGEYLSFVDSDDVLHPRFIERLYRACVEQNAPLAFCGFSGTPLWEEKQEAAGCLPAKDILERFYTEDHVMYTVAWNKLYRRELIGQERFPEGKIHEDEYFTPKMIFSAERIARVPDALYFYRRRSGSITSSAYDKRRLDILDAYPARREFFLSKGAFLLAVREEQFYLSAILGAMEEVRTKLSEDLKLPACLLARYRSAYRTYDKKGWSFRRRCLYALCYVYPGIYGRIKKGI